VTLDELARAAGVACNRIEQALRQLEQAAGRGWVVQRHGDRVQLATAPRFAAYVRRFLGLERETRLSTAALETLAIIAYQQPVTRAAIEAVRGVDCSGVLATLLARGLIEVVGRLQTAGNPLQYGTTPEFLLHFGLKSLADLPPLGQVDGRDLRTTLTQAIAGAQPEHSSNGAGTN
jgi:segregation and condensation protein B